MIFAVANTGISALERRDAKRALTDCPAELRLPSGIRSAQLYDISQTGAQLSLANPPPVGASALLKWGQHEYFVTVAWASATLCGVIFDRPISDDIVYESAQMPAPALGPAARVSNIALGGRRSPLVTATDRD